MFTISFGKRQRARGVLTQGVLESGCTGPAGIKTSNVKSSEAKYGAGRRMEIQGTASSWRNPRAGPGRRGRHGARGFSFGRAGLLVLPDRLFHPMEPLCPIK